MSPTGRCDSLVGTRQMRLVSWLAKPEARPVETFKRAFPVATARLPRRGGPGFHDMDGPDLRSAVCSGSPHVHAASQHAWLPGNGESPKEATSSLARQVARQSGTAFDQRRTLCGNPDSESALLGLYGPRDRGGGSETRGLGGLIAVDRAIRPRNHKLRATEWYHIPSKRSNVVGGRLAG